MRGDARQAQGGDSVRRLVLLGGVAILVVMLAGSAVGRDEVRIHLKWLHSAQFAGLYAAITNGFFETHDIDVELIEGAATEDVLMALSRGEYEFVFADPSRHLAAVEQGAANMAVAAVYQIDPVVVFSLAERGIHRPEDLVGKRVMSFPTSYVIPAMLARVGVDAEAVDIGAPSFDLTELYSGVYDAWSGYLTNEVRRARADGYDVAVMYPTDYGVRLYGDVLIARRELVESEPELVQRVVTALFKGWAWALSRVDEAAELALRWDPLLDPDEQREILELSLPFVHAGELGLGGMADDRWIDMAQMMMQFELLAPGFDVENAYTLEFVAASSAPVP